MIEVGKRLNEHMRGHKTVADLGAGKCPWVPFFPGCVSHYAAIEGYKPFLEMAELGIYPYPRLFVGDMREFDKILPAEFNDVAMMVDSLEHITMSDASKLVEQLKKRFKKILLFIPLGVHQQDSDPSGMGQHEAMTHKSTWEVADLERLGFQVEVLPNYHNLTELKDGRAGFCVWEAA